MGYLGLQFKVYGYAFSCKVNLSFNCHISTLPVFWEKTKLKIISSISALEVKRMKAAVMFVRFSHISACKHFNIPWGATNPWAKPHHQWACEQVFLFGFILVRLLPFGVHQLLQSTRQCHFRNCPSGRVCSAGELRLSLELSNSTLSLWMTKEQKLVHIPQSLPLHTHGTSCYLNTVQYTLQATPGCASLR